MKEALVKYSKGKILRDFKLWRINELTNTATFKNESQIASINLIYCKKWLIGLASENKLKSIAKIITY